MGRSSRLINITIIILLSLTSLSYGAGSYDIQGYGDHSLWVLVNSLKAAFTKETGVKLDLIEEFAIASKGCSKGILHAARGKPDRDFGLVCCDLNPDDIKRYHLSVYPVAREPLTIIVNNDNPINNLTQKQVRDIFSGKITSWKSVGGKNQKIALITRLHCKEHIANWRKIVGEPEGFAQKRLDVSSEPDMARTVSDFKGAIGHLEMSSFVDAKGVIKYISIDGNMPTEVNLEMGRYPFWTILSVVTRGEAKGKVLEFIEYLKHSPTAREYMLKYGMQQLGGN